MLKLYHAPWSRSSGVLWLLEELGQPYEIEIVDIRAEGGVPESYRKRSADGVRAEVPGHEGFDFGGRPCLSDAA